VSVHNCTLPRLGVRNSGTQVSGCATSLCWPVPSHLSRADVPGSTVGGVCHRIVPALCGRRGTTMSRSSVLPRKRQGAKEDLCLDLSVRAISRCHGRYRPVWLTVTTRSLETSVSAGVAGGSDSYPVEAPHGRIIQLRPDVLIEVAPFILEHHQSVFAVSEQKVEKMAPQRKARRQAPNRRPRNSGLTPYIYLHEPPIWGWFCATKY
jgi:hypothetical protein